MSESREVVARELDYHERLYSGFAQQHFAKPAVRALRAHMAKRILRLTGAGARSVCSAWAAASATPNCSSPRK